MKNILWLASALALTTPFVARADDDHERALAAVERGEALPLDALLSRVVLSDGERLIDVELEREDGRWVYELEFIDARGRVREIEMDALTGDTVVDD